MIDPCDTRSFPRRTLLTSGALLGAATLLGVGRPARGDEPPAESAPATPTQALERLRAGNERFAAGTPHAPYRDLAHLRAQAPKQTPFAAVLGFTVSECRSPV